MDAVELLIKQHRRLEGYLDAALHARNAEDKRRVFELITEEVAAHIAAEEKVFYPAVRAKWTEYDLLLSLEEHLSLKRLLTDLLALSSDDRSFHIKLKVLTEQLVHHHRKEEDYLFPKVNELMPAAERAALGSDMHALQEEIKNDPAARAEICCETDEAAPLLQG